MFTSNFSFEKLVTGSGNALPLVKVASEKIFQL